MSGFSAIDSFLITEPMITEPIFVAGCGFLAKN